MPHRWCGWSTKSKRPHVSFEGMKPEAVVPHDIMGEPPEIKIGDVEKGAGGGGSEGRPRLPGAALQPQRASSRTRRSLSGMRTAAWLCSIPRNPST